MKRFKYRIVLDVFSDEEGNPDMPGLNVNSLGVDIVQRWEAHQTFKTLSEITVAFKSGELVEEV